MEMDETPAGPKVYAAEGVHDLVVNAVVESGKSGSFTLLDIGTGEGAIPYRLKKIYGESNATKVQITGTDINERAFKLDDVPLVQWDLNKEIPPGLTGSKFDVITCVEVIEHIENPWKLVRDCNALLAEGGVMILTTPNIQNWRSRLYFLATGTFSWFTEQDADIAGHINPLPIWELSMIFKKNGFAITKIQGNERRSLNRASLKTLAASALTLLSFPLALLIRNTRLAFPGSGFTASTSEILMIKANKSG